MKSRVFFLICIPILLLLAACSGESAASGEFLKVSLKDLFANPQVYNGRELCTDGIYLRAFEVSALADAYEYRDGHRYLVEPYIWVEHPAVETFECVDEGDLARYCVVVVCGKFEYGGRYGHVGGYQYQFSEIEPFSGRSMYFPETRQAVPVQTPP